MNLMALNVAKSRNIFALILKSFRSDDLMDDGNDYATVRISKLSAKYVDPLSVCTSHGLLDDSCGGKKQRLN
jgi:hypothetical protein